MKHKRQTNAEFIRVINDAIKRAKIRKKQIAEETGLAPSTITRIFNGISGVGKPYALAVIRSINNIAGKPILDERDTLELAGLGDGDKLTFDFEIGDGARLILDGTYSKDAQKEIVEVAKIAFEIAVRKLD